MSETGGLPQSGGRLIGLPSGFISFPLSPPRTISGRKLRPGRRGGLISAVLLLLSLMLFTASSLPAADAPAKAALPRTNSAAASSAVGSDQIPSRPTAEESTGRPVQLAEAVPGSGEFPLFRTLGGLGLVVSFILGGFVVARRVAPQYFKGCSPDRMLRVLETLPMGDKRSIAVVQVGGRRYLVGNTAHQISILSDLGSAPEDFGAVEPLPAAAALQDAGGAKARVSHFRNLFEQEKSGRAGGSATRPIPAELRAKMRRLRESLEG